MDGQEYVAAEVVTVSVFGEFPENERKETSADDESKHAQEDAEKAVFGESKG